MTAEPAAGRTNVARPSLVVGILLCVVSSPPLILIGRELVIGAAVSARYSVQEIVSSEKGVAGEALHAAIGSHRVELNDDRPVAVHQPFTADQDLREAGQIRVVIDGRVHSRVAGTIRLMEKSATRYWHFVYLFRLVDAYGPERIVVAQSLGYGRYRTTSVFPDGRIVDDQFDYDSRCTPPVRALLIRSVVGHPSGFCSDVASVLPSLWYPVLYPFVSGMLGVAFIAAGVSRHRPRRQA